MKKLWNLILEFSRWWCAATSGAAGFLTYFFPYIYSKEKDRGGWTTGGMFLLVLSLMVYTILTALAWWKLDKVITKRDAEKIKEMRW